MHDSENGSGEVYGVTLDQPLINLTQNRIPFQLTGQQPSKDGSYCQEEPIKVN